MVLVSDLIVALCTLREGVCCYITEISAGAEHLLSDSNGFMLSLPLC